MPYDATRTDLFPRGRLVVAPAVGQVVHYVPRLTNVDGTLAPVDEVGCWPSLVFAIGDGLAVDLDDDGEITGAEYDQDGRRPGTWHYGCAACQSTAGGVNEPAVASQE